MSSTESSPSLWRNADFLKFWSGEAVSQIGAQIAQLALPLTAILTLHATSSQVGLVNAASYAPFLAALFVGVWVDRMRRRPLMIASNIGRAVLIGLVPILHAVGMLRIEFLYLVALIVGGLTVVFDISYQSYFPILVGKDGLVEGNSKLQGTSSLAQIGGPGLAGLLVQLVTAPIALALNAGSYVVSVVTLMLIRTPEPAPATGVVHAPMRQSIGEGISIVVKDPYLRPCALQSGLYNLCWISLQTVFVLYASRELHMSAGSIGFLLAAGALGSLLGSLVAKSLKQALGLGRAILVALGSCCVAPFLIPAAPRGGPLFYVLGIIAFALIGGGATMANIHIISLRQVITPEKLMGRMNAGYRFISWGTLPFGGLIGGWLGGVIGLRPTLVVTAFGFLSAVVVMYFSPVRKLVDFPAPLADAAVAEPVVPLEGVPAGSEIDAAR